MKTATEIRAALERGEMTATSVMQESLERIRALDPKVRAFLTIRPEDELLAEAAEIDRRRSAGTAIGALAGMPIAVKDSICTAGLRTTAASRMLENFVPPTDATVVARIRHADGIVLGKTNLDEFCMGSSTENSAFHPTLNPVNHEYVPGGTSGGSAAAVAAGFAPLALGSDTGGSVRQPAAFCGVVGIKPTYGRVSRSGLISYASSFDQIGTIGTTVDDAALLLSVISGHDPSDSTSANLPPIAAKSENRGPLVIGVPALSHEAIDGEVFGAIDAALDALTAAGHRRIDVQLPDPNLILACYYVIACAEASSNLARYDGTRYGAAAATSRTHEQLVRNVRSAAFGEEVKRRIMLGTFVLSAGYYDDYYGRALAVRANLIAQLRAAFAQCDVIVQPITPTAAFRLGEKSGDPLRMYLADLYSVSANVAGVPSIAIPCGTTSAGLPIGLQILAPWNEDDKLLAFAREMERRRPAGWLGAVPAP